MSDTPYTPEQYAAFQRVRNGEVAACDFWAVMANAGISAKVGFRFQHDQNAAEFIAPTGTVLPATVPAQEAEPTPSAVATATEVEPEVEEELTDERMIEIAGDYYSQCGSSEQAAQKLVEEFSGVTPQDATAFVLRALEAKLKDEQKYADESAKIATAAKDKELEATREADKVFAENYALKHHKRKPVTPEETTRAVKLWEQERAWKTPIPLDDVLLPVLPFRESFLPKTVRLYCTDVASRMSVPMDFAGIAALEVLFGVTGRRAFVCPKAVDKTWCESLTMSGGVVASSGAIKTPTWKLFTNTMVEQEADWGRAFKQAHAQYEEALEKWKESVAKEKKSKEAKADATVALSEPQAPTPSRRLILNDTTPEKAHSMMAENPSGLFYYRDELSAWVDELDKEGRETQRGLFLQAMNGDDAYTMDRIGRGSVTAIMSLSVAGNFQPDLLRRFLSDERNVQDGMMARFTLMVWPDVVKRSTVDRPVDTHGKATFRNVVRNLAILKPEAIRFHFDKDAQPLFFDWLQKLYDKIEGESHAGKQAHLSKWAGALPKYAALCQLVDLVALGGKFEGDFQIDVEHLQMALDFFHYLESHMARVYESAYSPLQIVQLALMEHIETGRLKDGFTIRDLTRSNWKNLRKVSAEMMDIALETLTERHWVRPVIPVTGPQGGRPATRWEVNPAIVVTKK